MSGSIPAKEVKAWPSWKVSTKRATWRKMTPTMQDAFLKVCRCRSTYPASKLAPRTLGALLKMEVVMPLSDRSLIPTYPGLELYGYVQHWEK